MTLVEVVAGLALLSTLLVAVLTTQARVTRQWSHAQRKLDAVSAADRLLAGWWRDVATFPRRATGHVPGDGALAWRTTPIANSDVKALAASVIRLEVLDERLASGSPQSVLASVEVVLDDEPRLSAPLNPSPSLVQAGTR